MRVCMHNAFERLDRSVQNILWDMKWSKLFQFQVDAINNWFDSNKDMLIMASTAAGKTEAVFLPIISTLAKDFGAGSIRVLYIGPLKALINDQFSRLEELCLRSDLPVHRWHGDVGSNKKSSLIKNPCGILLITPESLESLLIRHGRHGTRLFGNLDAIVIDEMHVFLDSERGRQLSSQMARIDAIRSGLPKSRRIGLSATIGDQMIAQKWLSGVDSQLPTVIESKGTNDIELVLKTFVDPSTGLNNKISPKNKAIENSGQGEAPNEQLNESPVMHSIAEHILEHFSTNTNLIFCNQKTQIELLADYISCLCRKKRIPNNFLVHHGSLSKVFRETVESELKSSRACTAICSSTLELGIDIGSVEAVGQIGPPHSVSALKQRLGRSGRREGKTSRLFMYIPVSKHTEKSSLPDRLYPKLIQTIALINLMAGSPDNKGWIEPPEKNFRDYSTFIQQILSVVLERGGLKPADMYKLLCSTNTFGQFDSNLFKKILYDLSERDLIEQSPSGEIILGMEGERLTGYYDFFAAFETPTTYDVVANSGPVGSVEGLPGHYLPEQYMLLGGKRWQILSVDENRTRIFVIKAKGKKAVSWSGGVGNVHKVVRKTMYKILKQNEIPHWFEPKTKEIFGWACQEFLDNSLGTERVVKQGNNIYVFTWTGTKATHTLNLVFRLGGLKASEISDEEICLAISKNDFVISDVSKILKDFCENPIDASLLVRRVFFEEIPPVGKHGIYLSSELRADAYAAKYIDIDDAVETAKEILRCI